MSEPRAAASQVMSIAEQVEARFRGGRRVLSFAEFLALFDGDPVRHSRDASRYLRDVFDHYGKTTIAHPWGEFTRFNLFDLPWEPPPPSTEPKERSGPWHRRASRARAPSVPFRAGRSSARSRCRKRSTARSRNFVREGRPNRLILLHGPNGSAKSTIASCMMAALEHYSTLDEGALYRFHWVFPVAKDDPRRARFREREVRRRTSPSRTRTFRTRRLTRSSSSRCAIIRSFSSRSPERQKLLEAAYRRVGGSEPPSDWMLRGQLSHKSQQVFEALLSSYHGSYTDVLRHVQVERYFISRRYRVGAVTIGPQLSVDAAERQITMDRSLQALPASLQAVTLYDAKGELIDAAGGVLEFSDLLKRPLDAFKYLQL